jgi:hypothetical protein
MTTRADQRGWGRPDGPAVEDHLAKVTAGGVTVTMHEAVADVFRYLNTELAKHYRLAGYADDYGRCFRPVRGYEQQWATTHNLKWLSNHSWGLAEDLDSSINPMTKDLHAQHEFIRAVVDPILAHFGGRLLWGGEYTGARKDYMHFEYVGTRSQADDDSALARHLLASGDVPAPDPTPTDQEVDMTVIVAEGRALALLTNGRLFPLKSTAEKDALEAAGVPAKRVTPAEFDQLDHISQRVAG